MGTADVRVDGDNLQIETMIEDSGVDPYTGRLCIGTPTLGNIRMEWHQARIGQVIPMNWSMVMVMEWLGGYVPMRYLVADAQNLIIQKAVEGEFDWLLLYEDDVLPPVDAFIRINKYMTDAEVPIVSGLYYLKALPSEPLVFRGRGTGAYHEFEIGDLVWCDGVPTGFLLVHMSIIREMWRDCEEYEIRGRRTRRMFRFPRDLWKDPETGYLRSLSGTSDLDWCTRVMKGGYLKKAGWSKFQRRKYPFLVDTNIFCHHITPEGKVFP